MATGQAMSSYAPMISALPRRPMIIAARRTQLQVRSCSGTSHVAPLRRSGNYHPNIWTDEHLQSFTSTTTVQREATRKRINVLKEQTRNLIRQKPQVAEKLQLIDHLQQLGVAYHFKDEIADVLSGLHASLDHVSSQLKDDLHATSLLFRLLRANGFSVSQDLFETFRDEKGNLEVRCENRIKGLLSLYEASYWEKEGESVLKEAMDFATEQLKGFMEEEGSALHELAGGRLREQVAHALQLPLNWQLERVQHRWFIEACRGDDTIDPLLLEFAKLDYNLVQDMYNSELRELSEWWSGLGLVEKLPFFRDRLLENYLWGLGFTYEPDSWRCRMIQTKAICLVTLIDDIYDVYGTLDELPITMSSPQNPNPRSPPSSSPPLPQPSPPPLPLLLSLRRRSPNPPPPPPPPPPFSSPPQPPPPPFSAPPSSPPQTSLLRLSLRRRTQQALTTDSSSPALFSPALFSPAPLHCSLLTATSSPLATGRRPLPLSPPRPPSWRLLRPLVLRYRRPHSRHQGPAHQGNLKMGKTYVVFVGREPGIYDTWITCNFKGNL